VAGLTKAVEREGAAVINLTGQVPRIAAHWARNSKFKASQQFPVMHTAGDVLAYRLFGLPCCYAVPRGSLRSPPAAYDRTLGWRASLNVSDTLFGLPEVEAKCFDGYRGCREIS
jgi:hypothetical protein